MVRDISHRASQTRAIFIQLIYYDWCSATKLKRAREVQLLATAKKETMMRSLPGNEIIALVNEQLIVSCARSVWHRGHILYLYICICSACIFFVLGSRATTLNSLILRIYNTLWKSLVVQRTNVLETRSEHYLALSQCFTLEIALRFVWTIWSFSRRSRCSPLGVYLESHEFILIIRWAHASLNKSIGRETECASPNTFLNIVCGIETKLPAGRATVFVSSFALTYVSLMLKSN